MRILYLTANPQFVKPDPDTFVAQGEPDRQKALAKYEKLDLWPELSGVTDALFDARSEGRVELEVVPEVRREDVHRHLAERPVTVLHFSGHGERAATEAEEAEWGAALILKDEKIFGEYVPNEWLVEALRGKGIRIVVLNCCWSAGLARNMRGVADCIVGTTLPVQSSAAAEFSAFFYDALQRGMTLREIRQQLADLDGITETTYHFEVVDESILDQVIAPFPVEERDMSPPRKALYLQTRIRDLVTNRQRILQADGLKVLFGLAVALLGWYLLGWMLNDGDCDAKDRSFLAAFACGIGKYEPFAIMAMLSGVTLGRLAGYLRLFAGAPVIVRLLKLVSLLPPARAERELDRGRVAELIAWLEHTGDTPK